MHNRVCDDFRSLAKNSARKDFWMRKMNLRKSNCHMRLIDIHWHSG